MTVIAGRGAQVTIGGLAQQAARGSYSTSRTTNAAEKLSLETAGTWSDGSTVDGSTLTGAAPYDVALASPDGPGTVPMSVSNTLTAHAGGTQAAALALTAGINRITIVASGNDSVRLPAMLPGQSVVVINSAASNSAQVYGAGTATINDVATATGVALAAGKVAIYVAVTAGLIYGGALA